MDKETKYIDLFELQTRPEFFLLAKLDIESNLEEKEKRSLNDFISALQLTKVYSNNKSMIAYSYINGNEFNYVFYISVNEQTNENTKDSILDDFKKKLESINYDEHNLKKTNYMEMFDENAEISIPEYFVIDNEFYK